MAFFWGHKRSLGTCEAVKCREQFDSVDTLLVSALPHSVGSPLEMVNLNRVPLPALIWFSCFALAFLWFPYQNKKLFLPGV